MNWNTSNDLDTPMILIVDDTPSNLSVVVNLFEDRGYRVAIAQDGEEGLQRAQLVRPDLILLDVMMPGIDGFEACRRLKEESSTRDIPVVFMTALASSEHKVRGFQVGAVDYVTKPLQIDEVMARVGTHLKLSAAQKKLAEHNEELERRVAERTAELAAREREFRTLVENAPDDITRHDRQGRYFYINPQHEKTLGMPVSDLLGKTPTECFPGIPDVVAYQAVMTRVIETGQPGEYAAILPGDGEGPRYHSIRLVAERDANDEIVGVLAIGRDITALKWAEQQLAIKGAALAQMHEAAYFVDDQAHIFYVNEEASRQLGYSREEFLGMTVMDIAPGWTAEMVANAQQGLSEGGACTFEAEHRRKDGSILPVEINLSLLKHEGKAFGLAMVRDITERKAAERELRLLNRAMNTSSEAAFLMDARGRFVYVNEEACCSLGYSREELLTMTPIDIDPDITGEVLAGLLDSIFTHGPSRSPMESRHRTRDGRIFPIEIAASPLKLEGQDYCLTMVRDITERKRAERELHLLNRALDNTFDATYLIDEDMRLRYVNEAAVRALGYSREELLSLTLLDIDPYLKPDMLRAVMAQTDTLGRFPGIIETQHRRKDGSVFPIEVGATVFDYEGERLHLTTVRDITERKRAEEALAAREREFRTLAENIPDTIIRYDAQARKTYVNTAVVSFIGIGADALIGKTPQETLPTKKADQADAYMTNLRRTLDSGEPQEIEVELHHMQQGPRVLNIRFVAERDEQGEIVGALMVGRDITAMKAIENELMEREQRYHEIFDNAVEGMYLLEVTEDGRFRNLDINPALAASTGMPRAAMIGQFVDDTVPEDMGKQIVEKYRRCVAAGATITENIELDLPAGKRHYISTITPIHYDGRVHRLIGISRDITELKKAERALEESRAQLRGLTARREEAREEERKYIAREVHDELGQILTGLQLNVSVLAHKFAADSAPLREQLNETRMLTDRALAVARNVASALRPAALDMGIVSALEWLVGRFGTNTGIHCEVHAEDTDIQLDESQAIALFRIVQESLTNVARHAKADRIEIDFGMMGDDYSLKVRDNGAGFDEKTAKADSFGLVGMRERALLLGGEVVINSKPGEGTEVEVRIPAHNVSRLS